VLTLAATGGPPAALVLAADRAQTPSPLLPPPVLGKSVNLHRASGTVLFEVPGAKEFVKLTEDVQVPLGTTLDTVNGRVTLITATDKVGGSQHAWFYDGVFTVGQTSGPNPVTELSMPSGGLSCPATTSRVRSAAKKPKQRKLWGDGSGSFRTRGQFSAATVRGTKWVVVDRCDGTLTRVVHGVVEVRDFVRHKTITLRAGKQYLARRSK
jgi:hypothetical protein